MLIKGTSGDDGLYGTADNDKIYGYEGDDGLLGAEGDDYLAGGAGDDITRGDSGNDTLLGGAGDDFHYAGTGDDYIDGGSGINRLTFRPEGIDNDPGNGSGVTVSLLLQGVAQDTGQGMDTLVNIQNLSGTVYADSLTGDGEDNWLVGGGGNDTLDGQGGDDLLSANGGSLVLRGGDGHDAVEFSNNGQTGAVIVSLAIQGSAQATGQGTVRLVSIEDLSGSFDGDRLTGDKYDNTLAGDDAGDTLIGGAGNDGLYGDGYISIDSPFGTTGPITLFPDLPPGYGGADLLNGGAGMDTLDGGQGADTLSGGNDEDQLSGGDDDDVLSGGKGHDVLTGDAGADTLSGGNDRDTFAWLNVADSTSDSSDLVTDLAKHDTVDLSAIDANVDMAGDQAFVLVSALTGVAGQAALSYAAGVTSLTLDVDGDGVADSLIRFSGDQTGHTDYVL